MKYTYTSEEKERILAMAKAFKGCRKYLPRSHGVCEALYKWLHRHPDGSWGAAEGAEQLVHRAINPHLWLESWAVSELGKWLSDKEMLALRHKWLDKLIADCEEAARS